MKRKVLTFLLLLGLLLPGFVPIRATRAAPDIVINEIRIDQPSTDNDEYFELAGAASESLDGLTYLVIGDGTDGSGVIEAVVDLTGNSIPASGFFVAAESTFSLGTADLVTNLNFENSDNVTHLLVRDFSGANGDDLDTNDDGVLDSTPWTELVDLIALVEEENPPIGTEFHYGPPSVGPDGSFVPGQVFRCEDEWLIGLFDPVGGDDTPGAENNCAPSPPSFGVCFDPATFIHDVQGAGFASPLVGDVVTVEGVVVATFQGPNQIGGYNIQEEDADADPDPQTSEGLYIFDNTNTPDVGDTVRVQGTVAESFDLTRLNNIIDFADCGSGGTATAATVSLPVSSVDDFERFEGMLVTLPQTLYISEYFNFDRFGEIVLTTNRQYQPTALFEPGSTDAANLAQTNSLSRITLDDGRGNQNPDPAIHPNGDVFNLDNLFRGGDIVSNLTGVVNYDFGLYRIQPTQGANYTKSNERPSQPDDVGGNLKVASFNVLNYFTTLDDGVNDICGPAGDQECRGADNAEEFTRQRDKIIAALSEINADVVGLIEIENNPGDVPTADLVSSLNDALGEGTYDYVATGAIGTDAIRQAFIYKPATVSLVGDFAVLDSDEFVDPNNTGEARNRPALAQTFIDRETGGIFTAVVNHFKSKGSPCGSGDDDLEQGSCNLTRTLTAQVLSDWLATDPTNSGDADVLIIGDLNSYDKEDPIDVLLANNYTDLVKQYQGEMAYSYVFDGQLGYLDYALANPDLIDEVSGLTIWHINADEPDILDYDTSFKQDAQDALYEPNAYRSSDHDPVLVGLDQDTPFELKENTIEVLTDLLSVGDSKTAKRLEKAIGDIQESLNPDYWDTEISLSDQGHKVFDGERKAVSQLILILESEDAFDAEVQSAINMLLESDRMLAQVAINTAIMNDGDAEKIAAAEAEMLLALEDIKDGIYVEAINHYKTAWDQAFKAGIQ